MRQPVASEDADELGGDRAAGRPASGPLAAQAQAPHADGDIALVMLRGARSPYVLLAGAPGEVVLAKSAAQEAALRESLPALLAALGDPRKIACVNGFWTAKPVPRN